MKTFDWIKNVERRRIHPPARKLVLLCVARGVNEYGVCTYVSLRDLMRAAGVGEAQVIRHLDGLEADGHMKPRQRRTVDGKPRHTRYQLTFIKPDPREDEPPHAHYERHRNGNRVAVGEILADLADQGRQRNVSWIEHVRVFEAANLRRKAILKRADELLTELTSSDSELTSSESPLTFERAAADLPGGQPITTPDRHETDRPLIEGDKRPAAGSGAGPAADPGDHHPAPDRQTQADFSANPFVRQHERRQRALAAPFMKTRPNGADRAA